MVVSRSLALLLFVASTHASVLELFGPSKDASTCAANIKEQMMEGSYPTMLTVLLVVGPIVSVLMLLLNIVILLQIKKKLVAETDAAMLKSFEVMDNVLVELMPRKIQKQLQTAINGGKSNKTGDSKDAVSDNKESGEASALLSKK